LEFSDPLPLGLPWGPIEKMPGLVCRAKTKAVPTRRPPKPREDERLAAAAAKKAAAEKRRADAQAAAEAQRRARAAEKVSDLVQQLPTGVVLCILCVACEVLVEIIHSHFWSMRVAESALGLLDIGQKMQDALWAHETVRRHARICPSRRRTTPDTFPQPLVLPGRPRSTTLR
jgi:hypothetical protein